MGAVALVYQFHNNYCYRIIPSLTCLCTSCLDSSYAPLNTNACLNTTTLIYNNSITIALINRVTIDLKLYNLRESVLVAIDY
jgi:hypothetical protein